MDSRARSEQVSQHVSEALRGTGVVVADVNLQQAGRRRLVRVLVARDVSDLDPQDRTSPVSPLTLDEVAEASRAVSAVLDETDVMGDAAYTLEVSSAGVDRPLVGPDAFRRNVGRLVKVTTDEGTTTARLLEAGPDGIVLADTDGVLPHDRITRALVQVEFTRPDGEDL